MTALEGVKLNLASLKEAFGEVSAPVERHSNRPYAFGNQLQSQEDLEEYRETDRGCVSGTGCSRIGFVPPCLQVLWKQRGYLLFQAMLLNIVQGNVNRSTGDYIRHFARPYLLWKSKSVEKTGVFVSHLSPQEHAWVVRLVGHKCTVKCLLDGLETNALWDTGAQVSIISQSWLKQCLPGCDIRDIAELLGMDGLDLKAANGTDLPYEDWVELTFNLIRDDFYHTIKVPFLIAKDSLDMPIVGCNVIEEITKFSDRGCSARVNGLLIS